MYLSESGRWLCSIAILAWVVDVGVRKGKEDTLSLSSRTLRVANLVHVRMHECSRTQQVQMLQDRPSKRTQTIAYKLTKDRNYHAKMYEESCF